VTNIELENSGQTESDRETADDDLCRYLSVKYLFVMLFEILCLEFLSASLSVFMFSYILVYLHFLIMHFSLFWVMGVYD